MDDTEGRRAIAEAVYDELRERDVTQAELGALMAKVDGEPKPYPQGRVADWLARRRGLTPTVVFTMERALGVEPGMFSRLGGYLPVEALPSMTLEECILKDAELSLTQRQDLLAQIEGMKDRARERRRRRQPTSER